MSDINITFIDLCIKQNSLQFGSFTLKSGRISPYFYNFGIFNDGNSIAALGKLYAKKIIELDLEFDVLFGPAYKGIPLVIATVIALQTEHNINKPFCFNRKLIKQHGEKGELVGASLEGRVLILDDVITAGTAILESIALIKKNKGKIVGAITSLDRQEIAKDSSITAIDSLKENFDVEVFSLAKLDDILSYLNTKSDNSVKEYIPKIVAYQTQYCVKHAVA